MGCCAKVTDTTFPKQGSFAGKRARVHFHYNTARAHYGKIVRDDAEERSPGVPGLTIIALDDGRYVLSTECQFVSLS